MTAGTTDHAGTEGEAGVAGRMREERERGGGGVGGGRGWSVRL